MRDVGELMFTDIALATQSVDESCYVKAAEFYIKELTQILRDTIVIGDEEIAIHVHKYRELEAEKTRLISEGYPLVALDFFSVANQKRFGMSRLFDRDGKAIGYVPRPGYPSFEDQLRIIAEIKLPVIILEDDYTSGGTTVALLNMFMDARIPVYGMVFGIMVGDVDKINEVPMRAVKKYKKEDFIDGPDPFDFFPGATNAGGVIHLDNGIYGRSPYLAQFPWTSPDVRASIPKQQMKIFSLHVLELVIETIAILEKDLGKSIHCSDLALSYRHTAMVIFPEITVGKKAIDHMYALSKM